MGLFFNFFLLPHLAAHDCSSSHASSLQIQQVKTPHRPRLCPADMLLQSTGRTAMKVLYVEDNDDDVYLLKTRLELLGDFEVLTARNGEKGCELAAGERPDIIIMDLEMPVMDGWEAARWLKREPQTRDIPIVALSAHALVGEREKAFAAGCDAFDAKPIQFERLLATLRRLGQAAGDGGGRS